VWEQVEKQVVEAMTHMEATGTCVSETECSEMLVFKLKTPVNHPEESIQH
jgi:hypothetical protein